MPELDGFELACRVRQSPRGKYIPAIAVSAHVRPEEAASALSAGHDLHVTKAVEVPQLVTAINTLVALRSASGASSKARGADR